MVRLLIDKGHHVVIVSATAYIHALVRVFKLSSSLVNGLGIKVEKSVNTLQDYLRANFNWLNSMLGQRF